MKIIFGSNSGDLPRPLVTAPSLAERREMLTKRFFMDLLNEKNCLHELLPAKRDSDVTGKLMIYPRVGCLESEMADPRNGGPQPPKRLTGY